MSNQPMVRVAIVRYQPDVTVEIPYNFTGSATMTIDNARKLHKELGDAIQRFDAEEAAEKRETDDPEVK